MIDFSTNPPTESELPFIHKEDKNKNTDDQNENKEEYAVGLKKLCCLKNIVSDGKVICAGELIFQFYIMFVLFLTYYYYYYITGVHFSDGTNSFGNSHQSYNMVLLDPSLQSYQLLYPYVEGMIQKHNI